MPPPPPDPLRPSPANEPAAGGPPPDAPAPAAGSSTGSHRPAPAPSLSEVLRAGSSSSRRNPTADIAAQLLGGSASHVPLGPDVPLDPDDAPTVITQKVGRPLDPPLPPPPYVVGEVPSIAGRRLGHFELIEAIGSGGMAAVLKARDLELGRTVALKILPPESARDPESVTRFKQEARAAAMLDHDNVARVYFCGEDQGLHFIAFEFVEGVTLRNLIDRRGVLPAGECVRYMIQVAAGLNHAAERGVVHRDIKPSNIIITPDGRAKIVDMGLARHLEAGSVNGGLTQSGVTLGTFDYISPEQALDPRRADVRSDIYSLGCTFYHALTGRPPVPEGTAAKKLQAHQQLDPIDPRELNPAVPDELAAMLARMMAKDPDRRYQTPAELIAHLKGVAEKLNLAPDAVVADSAVRAVAADPRVLPEPPRLQLGLVAAVAAVAIVVVAVVATTWGPSSRTSGPPSHNDGVTKTGDKSKTDPNAGAAGPNAATNPGPQPNAAGVVTVASAAELVRALGKEAATHIRLQGGHEYDLTRFGTIPIVPRPQIELSTLPTGPPARVKLPAGLLTLAARKVAVHGVSFEVTPPTAEEGEVAAESAGLGIADAAEVELSDCVFVSETRLTNQAAVDVLGGSPRVHLARCLFGPGSVGVRVRGRAEEVRVEDCGFGPHDAAVQFREGAAADAGRTAAVPVRLYRSSFMLDGHSAAVALADEAAADVRVSAGYCVFAAAGARTEPAVPGAAEVRRGVVVRVAGAKPDHVRFVGDPPDARNVYYRVDPLATAERSYTFEDCKAEDLPSVEEGRRVALRQRPWEAAGDVTEPFGDPKNPFRAFRLRVTGPTADRDLFVPQGGAVRVVGAQFTPPALSPLTNAGRVYAGVSPVWPPDRPAESKQRIWFPRADPNDNLPPNVYSNLVKLLQDVRPGDEVLIRQNRPEPIELNPTEVSLPSRVGPDREFKITFRPEERGKPVILTAAASDYVDGVLFKLMAGEVTFEGIEFRLKPAPGQETVTAARVVGARGCAFRDCVFTLDDERAAAVVVTGPEGVMRMDQAMGRSGPKVVFENCLVRGRGCGVSVPVSRAFELELTNCLTALDGPVLSVKGSGKEPAGGVRSVARLAKVTALLGGPLVELHGTKNGETRSPGLVPVELDFAQCLFAAVPGAVKPLVELDGVDPADADRVIEWSREGPNRAQPNRYANFAADAAAAVVRPPDGGDVRNWEWSQWLRFAHEVGRPVGTVTFAAGPTGVRELGAVKPADVRVTAVDFREMPAAQPADAGAEWEKVATPAAAGGAREPSE
jgi:tRNA A-37 threonylcarbamoyl transferase component Bud32